MTTTATFPVKLSNIGNPALPHVRWPARRGEEFPPAASSRLTDTVMMNLSGRATPFEAVVEVFISIAVGAAVSYAFFAVVSFASIL